MKPSQLLAAVAALSSVTAAWPDVFDKDHALAGVKNVLYGRQDSSESDASPEPTASPTESADRSTTQRPSATPTGDDEDSTTTNSRSGSGTPTGSSRPTKSSGKPKVTNFGPDVAAGGIAMVTPAAIAGPQYYKIGDWVHMAWNYTSLSITPSAVDVMATCSANQATYTIAVNQSVKATGEVFWNTAEYNDDHPNSPPLLTEMYTLLIYDSNSSATQAAKPGYLSPYSQHSFGMYAPQEYVPFNEYKCANCNSALSALEALTFKALLITSTTTIGSLVYFSLSFGLW